MTPSPNFISIYFTEEKMESFFFMIIGIISILIALILLFIIKYSFFKGFAVPLLVIGCLQLLVGTVVALRVPKDILRVEFQMKNEPRKIKTEEIPRMEKVQKNFVIYQWIEISLLITGLILFFLFFNSRQTFWKGFGIGLLIQAAIILSLDLVAKKRATNYIVSLTYAVSKHQK